MPKCPVCDSENPAGSVACGECFAPLGDGDAGAQGSGGPRAGRAQRPTGKPLIAGGCFAGAFGAFLTVKAVIDRHPAGDLSDPVAISQSDQLLNVAYYALWAGLLLFLAGCIIRAIWFLPGDDGKSSS
jgi:hypothetical protein